ncbi:hypothetical protein JCM11641_006418 [Rhodosporidiobolus odoratus]
MASAMASTSSYIVPIDSISPADLFSPSSTSSSYHPRLPSPPSQSHRGQPTSLVLDTDDDAVPAEMSGGRLKKYMCTWPGCGKCYTRPARLEEHQRAHTGERPFECPSCDATFARDSHLKAHARTHQTEEDKKYVCDEEGCEKKFWTNQHLKKHVDVVHRGKTYDCPTCDLSFKKHHLLRTHIAEEHSPEGADPFQCEHPGCGRTFKQKVHLKAHEKVHDPSRYLCLHPSCLPLPLAERQFPTWTLLQRHSKTAHPPRCPYPICAGKTFTTNRGLRNHLEIHTEEDKGEAGGAVSTSDGEGGRKRKRRRRRGAKNPGAGEGKAKKRRKIKQEEERLKKEEEDEEEKKVEVDGEDGSEWEERQESERDERMREDFRAGGKKKRKVLAEADGFPALPTLPFPPLLPHFSPLPAFPLVPLPDPTLSMSGTSGDEAGPSHRLSETPGFASSSVAVIEENEQDYEDDDDEEEVAPPKQSAFFDLLTGSNYSQPQTRPSAPCTRSTRASPSTTTVVKPSTSASATLLPRKYPCPFPSILALPFIDVGPAKPSASSPKIKAEEEEEEEEEEEDTDTEGTCQFWFKRVYDVERHLRARHGVEVVGGRERIGEWFEAEGE